MKSFVNKSMLSVAHNCCLGHGDGVVLSVLFACVERTDDGGTGNV